MMPHRPWRARPRPPVEKAPPIFTLLADFWALSPAMASGFWTAVSAATWSRAVSWRQQLLLFQAQKGQHHPAACRHLLYAASGASETVRLVDDLCAEGLLTRGEATRLQDALLCQVGAGGQWDGYAAVEPEWGGDLAATISQYWR